MKQVTWRVGWYSKVVLVVVCLSLIASGYSSAQTARDVVQKTFPSVVMLLMEDANSQLLSLGSGFFVNGDVVATNLHVIEGASGGYAKIIGEKQKYSIAGLVGADRQRDLALLKIAGAESPPLKLGDSSRVAVGDEVYAIGNPFGLEGTLSQGIVSGIRQIGSDFLFQITAPISPGSSGGPLLNAHGEVIGITVAAFKGGQNLNFAIPGSYLALLLQNVEPIVLLSPTPIKKEKSILDDLTQPNDEAIIGGNFTWQNQFYEFNGDYSFTLRNKLRESVQDVYCLTVFYDRSGEPLDVDLVHHTDIIPAGLAKRVIGSVDPSVKRLTTPPSKDNPYMSSFAPTTKVEFRILDFRILE